MSWYRSAFVVAVIVMGTGVCFARLLFGSCKKLEVVIAGPLSETESCLLLFGSCKKLEVVIAGPFSGTESYLIVETGPSFVSDFRGIVKKWHDCSKAFPLHIAFLLSCFEK